MNYEEFYGEASSLEKELNDSISAVSKLSKTISKDLKDGNLKDAWKNADQFAAALTRQQQAMQAMNEKLRSFDAAAYFNNGEFAQQLTDACKEKNVDVHGDFPVYEMFPYRVRIDAENQDLYLNRKKFPCMRPEYFADMIKTRQDKLVKASFNADSFVEELAAAYDTTILKSSKKKPDAQLLLTAVYKTMVPMARLRREYDQMAFAFDISRLYAENLKKDITTKDGRRVEIGPSKNNNSAIRIVDQDGNERFLATVRFFAG